MTKHFFLSCLFFALPVQAWAESPSAAMLGACASGDLDQVIEAIRRGADMETKTKDERGYTCLHIAVERNDFALALLLFTNGANRNVKNAQGESPYRMAMNMSRNPGVKNTRMAEFLKVFYRGTLAAKKYCKIHFPKDYKKVFHEPSRASRPAPPVDENQQQTAAAHLELKKKLEENHQAAQVLLARQEAWKQRQTHEEEEVKTFPFGDPQMKDPQMKGLKIAAGFFFLLFLFLLFFPGQEQAQTFAPPGSPPDQEADSSDAEQVGEPEPSNFLL